MLDAYNNRGLLKSTNWVNTLRPLLILIWQSGLKPDYALACLRQSRTCKGTNLGQHFAAITDFDTGTQIQYLRQNLDSSS